MPLVPLRFPPGVFRNGTKYEAKGRWFDTNLVRWVDGTLQPVGGWQKVQAGAEDINLSDEAKLSLPGESGDYAYVPDSTALDVTGDLDLRIELALDDWTPSSTASVIGKWGTTTNARAYVLRVLASGKLQLAWSTDGSSGNTSTVNSTVATGLSDGERKWIRATLDVDNGSSGHDVEFFTSDDGSSWSQLGGTVTNSGTTSINTSPERVEVGSQNDGADNLWAGDVWVAQVYDGIDGTQQLDIQFKDQLLGATSFTEDSTNGATVTIAQSGDPQAELVLDNVPDISIQGILAWQDNSGQPWLGMGTPARAWAFTNGALTEITPASFTAGQEDATASGDAYGDGAYGIGSYGSGDPSQTTITPAQSWQFDNFGEQLVAVARSDGQLLSWDLNTSNNLSAVSNAPTNNEAVVVTPERFLVALGASDNGRKVQWADQESLTTWTPAATNQAGDFILPGAGQILLGRRLKGETLIWTSTDLWAMQYIGGVLIYSFQQVGSDCGPISPRAVATVDGGRAFWMGAESFFVYDGFARPIPSEVSDYVFNDLNRLQASKIHAVAEPAFNEVRWYYCSSGSSSIDRYVVYNYDENYWAIGQLNRTAGVPRGVFRYPMATDNTGAVYDHERGNDYDDPQGNALTPFAESGPFEIAQGERLAVVRGLIPDEETLGDVQVKLHTALYPTDSETVHGPFTADSTTDVRATGRQVRLEVEQVNPNWRVGTFRLDVAAGSRR